MSNKCEGTLTTSTSDIVGTSTLPPHSSTTSATTGMVLVSREFLQSLVDSQMTTNT